MEKNKNKKDYRELIVLQRKDANPEEKDEGTEEKAEGPKEKGPTTTKGGYPGDAPYLR